MHENSLSLTIEAIREHLGFACALASLQAMQVGEQDSCIDASAVGYVGQIIMQNVKAARLQLNNLEEELGELLYS